MNRQAMPVQKGDYIDYKNSGAAKINVGDIVPIVNLCGVAETSIAVGDFGALSLSGVYQVASDTGAAYAVGDKLYWDATNNKATKTATSNVYLGVAIEPKASGGTTIRVKIG